MPENTVPPRKPFVAMTLTDRTNFFDDGTTHVFAEPHEIFSGPTTLPTGLALFKLLNGPDEPPAATPESPDPLT